MPAPQQIEGADGEHEDGSGHISRAHGVNDFGLRHGIEQKAVERGELHAHGLRLETRAHWALHPAVRDQDPERGDIGADADQPGDDEMADSGESIPSEEENPDKGRLEEERHQTFERERRAEDVAHVMRVVGPVGAELEFHGDAGGDTHGEIDTEERTPEPRHGAPDPASRHDVDALHHREQQRQAERQRHEQEMIERGERELQARELDDAEVGHRGTSGDRRWRATSRASTAGRSSPRKNMR